MFQRKVKDVMSAICEDSVSLPHQHSLLQAPMEEFNNHNTSGKRDDLQEGNDQPMSEGLNSFEKTKTAAPPQV